MFKKVLVLLAMISVFPVNAENTYHAEMMNHDHSMHGSVDKNKPIEDINKVVVDNRKFVFLPPNMKAEMLSNMRGHLIAIDRLLGLLNDGKLDAAADYAESELGMSSLTKHGAQHVGRYYPKDMQNIGSAMHSAASQFSLKAQEGDLSASYKALRSITASCNVCHAGYKVNK